jgi:hypothetical protein
MVIVSLSGVFVGVFAPGANVTTTWHDWPGASTTGSEVTHDPEAVKSAAFVRVWIVNGPTPPFASVTGVDCAVFPTATGPSKVTVAVVGEGAPGGCGMDCAMNSCGRCDGVGSEVGPVVSKNATSNGETT